MVIGEREERGENVIVIPTYGAVVMSVWWVALQKKKDLKMPQQIFAMKKNTHENTSREYTETIVDTPGRYEKEMKRVRNKIRGSI